jgi:hypothetical protein
VSADSARHEPAPPLARFAVISDPGDDPWEEGVFATRDAAAAFIDRTLGELAQEGLDPREWRPLFRVEPRAHG